ncbi:MAG: 4Fe-4S binding protein [Caldilineae bacterium]|nr:4Fe-4S binding protein [Anaerolineae bacterium]MCB0252629.1 4Fe-4S binding protein [Anaerolineae bacterium]MCB9153754.1 4Fe-4S binding protein [Caldilineae bacterium]
MFGTGLIKGLGVTIKHFVDTYVDDVKAIPSRYAYGYDAMRQMPDEEGLFTIQYPDEKRELPERFRYIPMLIYDTPKQEDRCTACGICAKVCPPQCIWIVRDKDPNGKPVPRPAEFFLDASICMSCGFCAEYCPFDAIKMNHDYELAVYERYPNLVYNMAELTVPVEYYASIWPTQYAVEEERRAEEEAKKAAKAAARAKRSGAKAAPAAAVAAKKAVEAKPAPAAAPPTPKPAAPAAAVSAADNPFYRLPNPAKTSGGYTVEEIAKRRAEAYDRYKARKGADAKQLHIGAAPAAAAVEAATPEAEAPVAEVEPAAASEPEVVSAAVAPAVTGEPAASAGGDPFRKLPNPAKTSGGYTVDEIAERRREAYARYKERKGADAKELH